MINLHYQRIWKVVQQIPAGKVSTYGKVADLAGLPGRARMVGKALGFVPENGFQNKEVPWFRVVRSSGQIAFPIESSCFNEQKERLMEEGVFVKGTRVKLATYEWQPNLAEFLFNLSF